MATDKSIAIRQAKAAEAMAANLAALRADLAEVNAKLDKLLQGTSPAEAKPKAKSGE
jgi:ubiquinone biosynthesis protein UbiJ